MTTAGQATARRLSEFPRRRYTAGPTPIEPLPRLSKELGGPRIFAKRDDMLGLAAGGNKTRKLEFLVADALERGADTLITCGAVQSNHCRLTLAAANREGLRCRLVLEERVPHSYEPDASGNNFLFRLLGVEAVSVVPGGTPMLEAMERVADEVRAEGRVPYVIPGGGSVPLGALGYVACLDEIVAQAYELGVGFDAIVCASGSAGTHAGLLAGSLLRSARVPVLGISVNRGEAEQTALVQRLTDQTLDLLGGALETPTSAVRVLDGYVGRGYSYPTEGMVEAVRLLARLESILLDPVYTGKTMAGLIDQCRRGELRGAGNVLFVHTGGAPALYAYERELTA